MGLGKTRGSKGQVTLREGSSVFSALSRVDSLFDDNRTMLAYAGLTRMSHAAVELSVTLWTHHED